MGVNLKRPDVSQAVIAIALEPEKYKAIQADLEQRFSVAEQAEAKAKAEQETAERMKAEINAAVAALGKERMDFEAERDAAAAQRLELNDILRVRENSAAIRETKAQEREDLVAVRERDVQSVIGRNNEITAELADQNAAIAQHLANIEARELVLADREALLKNRVNALVADL